MKMRRVFAWFSTFCMSLPYLCSILAQTIRLCKDNSKIINSSFSQHVYVYERLLEVKMSPNWVLHWIRINTQEDIVDDLIMTLMR